MDSSSRRYGPSALAKELVQSDHEYFEAGAVLHRLRGGVIAVMEGQEHTARGCVVIRVNTDLTTADPAVWIDDLEWRVKECGGRRVRMYLQTEDPDLTAHIQARGYQRREQVGLVRLAAPEGFGQQGDDAVQLQPMVDERMWNRKLEILRECQRAGDEADISAEEWVILEKHKCATGYMMPYLIMIASRAYGAVSTSHCGDLLRLKNLVICPGHTERDLAVETAVKLAEHASHEGKIAVGGFVADGSPELKGYRDAGYQEVVRQAEWTSQDLTI